MDEIDSLLAEKLALAFPKEEDQLKALNIFTILQSKEELRDWIHVYFGLYMPMGNISGARDRSYMECSSPVEAMWEVYKAVRDNEGGETPGFTLLSSRDSYKTLAASMLEVLLLIHFRTTIAHCAAIMSQSSKAIEYCSGFNNRIIPYLNFWGWKQKSDSKSRIEFITDKGESVYIQIIILTMAGSNSSHTQLMFVDEVDLCDPKAYQQAKFIPGVVSGKFPITIRLSTRKFAFGLMEKEIKNSPDTNSRVLVWNILDVTEYCPDTRCKPNKPKIFRYIANDLPLRQMSEDEFNILDETAKGDYTKIECFEGCAKCPMLPVCKTKLRDKEKTCKGDLWKPIIAVRNKIGEVDTDIADAELFCNKPASAGLIYRRFSSDLNTISLDQAYAELSGINRPITFDMFRRFLLDMDIPIYGGVDWAQSGESAFCIIAEVSNGEYWLLDMFAAKDLEPDDLVRLGEGLQRKWNVKRWYVDQAYPAYIKMFARKGLVCPKFQKDVPKGISNLRTAILDSAGRRRFKILKTDINKRLIDGFGTYHWKLDAQGNPTDEPDHTEESDIMDSVRYPFQMIFKTAGKGGVMMSHITKEEMDKDSFKNKMLFSHGPTNLLEEIRNRTANTHQTIKGKGIIFSS